ncbi:hypothetical protein, partial [Magnetovibrio blakemorei]|uniref:hypothetical protein n=1 Tax=Magnetovibrio blakemorei TaxID=28181 RepID=UPI001B8C6511
GTDLQMKDKDGNASYDGVVGSQTRGAVERAVREGKIKEVNNRIVEKRIQYMRSLPAHKFNPGWIPRAKSFLMQ